MNREEARKKAQALVAQMTLEEAASQMSYQAPAIERLGVPAYNWWNEALHGVARAGMATMYPQAVGMAATFDPKLVEELGDVSATEGRAKYNAASRHGDRDIYKGLTFWSP
ncbi:MAG: glycoside hydrolase family 3 protein, partial [Clostridia bacterium]|nr:glycoside hydrolase family 3 protein [Clostridia bacterium]